MRFSTPIAKFSIAFWGGFGGFAIVSVAIAKSGGSPPGPFIFKTLFESSTEMPFYFPIWDVLIFGTGFVAASVGILRQKRAYAKLYVALIITYLGYLIVARILQAFEVWARPSFLAVYSRPSTWIGCLLGSV